MDQQQQLAKLEELGFRDYRNYSWRKVSPVYEPDRRIQLALFEKWVACRGNWESPAFDDPWSAYCYAEIEGWGQEKRRLTDEGERKAAAFNELYSHQGCTCFRRAPCVYCVHPGNPSNLAEAPELWEADNG